MKLLQAKVVPLLYRRFKQHCTVVDRTIQEELPKAVKFYLDFNHLAKEFENERRDSDETPS